jgi:hypothetical protein
MNISRLDLALLACCLPLSACAEVDLGKIELPPGFAIEVYASGVDDARQMALGDQGVLFVGSRKAGNVYAVVDADDDQQA